MLARPLNGLVDAHEVAYAPVLVGALPTPAHEEHGASPGTWGSAIGAVLIVCAMSLVSLPVVLCTSTAWIEAVTIALMSLSAGTLISLVWLTLIPESNELLGGFKEATQVWVGLLGVIFGYVLENLHHASHPSKIETVEAEVAHGQGHPAHGTELAAVNGSGAGAGAAACKHHGHGGHVHGQNDEEKGACSTLLSGTLRQSAGASSLAGTGALTVTVSAPPANDRDKDCAGCDAEANCEPCADGERVPGHNHPAHEAGCVAGGPALDTTAVVVAPAGAGLSSESKPPVPVDNCAAVKAAKSAAHDCNAHGSEEAHRAGLNSLVGEVFHNFVDGIVVAVAFMSSTSTGIATTISVVLHELPQELGDTGA